MLPLICQLPNNNTAKVVEPVEHRSHGYAVYTLNTPEHATITLHLNFQISIPGALRNLNDCLTIVPALRAYLSLMTQQFGDSFVMMNDNHGSGPFRRLDYFQLETICIEVPAYTGEIWNRLI